MKHYVVILDWAQDDEQDVLVIGVAHSFEDASKIFKNQRTHEQKLLADKDWHVYEDDDWTFDAGEEGSWIEEHVKLWIQEVV